MFYRNIVQCQKLQQVFEVQSFDIDTGPQSFCYLFIALSIIRCSKSAQKFAVRRRVQQPTGRIGRAIGMTYVRSAVGQL